MQEQASARAPRVVARLPSGEIIEPGARTSRPGSTVCPGPDRWGSCPEALKGRTPPCTGADWYYRTASGGREWELKLEMPSAACPAVTLDPFGPVSVPGD